MSDEQLPWERWLEEHPDGAIGFEFEDGSTSPMFRTRDELEAFLDTYQGSPMVRVRRTRDVSGEEVDVRDAYRQAEAGPDASNSLDEDG